MYSIMTVIYGIPLSEEISKLIDDDTLPEDDSGLGSGDSTVCGFTELYHGSSDQHVGYCGVEISEFNECVDYIAADTLVLTATDEQKAEGQALVDRLDQRILSIAPPIGVYIIPSTS